MFKPQKLELRGNQFEANLRKAQSSSHQKVHSGTNQMRKPTSSSPSLPSTEGGCNAWPEKKTVMVPFQISRSVDSV